MGQPAYGAARSDGFQGTEPPCRICGNAIGNRSMVAREMLMGTREEFAYLECAACGCLQIAHIPEQIGRYYPEGYYSLRQPDPEAARRGIRGYLRTVRDASLLRGTGLSGAILQALRPAEQPFALIGSLGNPHRKSLLDVGCGSGSFLLRLRDMGMDNLLGIDPYISSDIEYAGGLNILRTTIEGLDRTPPGGFDIILFNHSFEHMTDPYGTLRAAAEKLSESGRIIVHIPTVSSLAWQQYRTDWVQLDAPRHIHLFSTASLQILADRAGLLIDDISFCSSAFQFWGSELYARGIPMSAWGDTPCNHFSAAEMRRFRAQARSLNRQSRGDQAAFYLKKLTGERT